MKSIFGWILVGTLVAGCGFFLWATVAAGEASIHCDQKRPGPTTATQLANATPPSQKASPCNEEGKPAIHPLLDKIAIPLAATLATYFGAAVGLASKPGGGSAGNRRPVTGRRRIPRYLRWGALAFDDDDGLAMAQTAAALVYLGGLLISVVYLYLDASTEGSLDSQFTHIIIKSQGNAFVGVVLGGVALVLGVQSSLRENDAETARENQS